MESNFNSESRLAELRPHLVVVARVEETVEDRGNLAEEGKAELGTRNRNVMAAVTVSFALWDATYSTLVITEDQNVRLFTCKNGSTADLSFLSCVQSRFDSQCLFTTAAFMDQMRTIRAFIHSRAGVL